MKNIIVNIKKEEDLYEKYNNKVSRDLINYLVRESKYTKDKITITINSNIETDIVSLIKEGLINSYNDSKKLDLLHNNKQILYFILGIICLIISTLFPFKVVKEVILIAGWVAIWEVVDLSLNVDTELKINRKLIEKLINSEYIVNKI